MKPSRFNLFIETDDGNKLAFNTISAALAEVLPDKYPVIQKILSDPDSLDSDEEEELFHQLIAGKFLVDDQTDEISQLKVLNRTQRFGKKTLVLTIAPTLSCNFKCDYCFEGQTRSTMNEDTEKALLDFGERHLRRSEKLMITWFGGEPTLCLPTIERLQKSFQSLSSRYGVSVYPSGIVTNGYLLDKGMSERLRDAGIRNAQVTLDGPQEIHDSRRKLQSGEGTFERILDNLKESARNLSILLRINIDRENLDSGYDLVGILEKEGILPLVNVNFAQVTATEGACADVKDRCLSGQEFSATIVELYKRLLQRDFDKIAYPVLSSGAYCSADSDGAFVVSPTGDLFKCWEEISSDNEKSVGSVFSRKLEPFQEKNLNRFLSWDPFEKSGCLGCNILPICMGGCPNLGIKYGTREVGVCSSWKYNLKEMLHLKYLAEQNEERR
ncbi:MAG: SPASM domain-containing protein [Candidatus Zixiibacteriota bacterium]|nr:MAG: SPASM domain-containing protein [candidate division Zixibacteria bacterium]